MFEKTDTEHAPWVIINADRKNRARLDAIKHMLKTIPYKQVDKKKASSK
jgi:polyphosphate kinase 2 (PPK2 family)